MEVLVNTGILGLLIFIIILLFTLRKIIKLLFQDHTNKKKNIVLIFFLIFFIVELIPIRSFGSIFTTFNGSIFWFFFGIITYINNSYIKNN